MDNVIRKGDPRWERLFKAWKGEGKSAGWLVLRSEQYRVIGGEDASVLFVPTSGNIDQHYGDYSQGVPQ